MRRTPTSIAMTVSALALVVGLAACGSSSGSDSEKDTTTTEASGGSDSSTTKPDDDTSTTDEDATTTVVATGGGDFCKDLADYINDVSASDIDVTDPDAYKQAIEESTKQGKEVLSNAPDELSGAVETILDAQDELIAALKKVDYDYTKLSPDAFDAMSSPDVQDAGDEVDAYITDTCGIDLQTPEVEAPEMPDVTAATIPSN